MQRPIGLMLYPLLLVVGCGGGNNTADGGGNIDLTASASADLTMTAGPDLSSSDLAGVDLTGTSQGDMAGTSVSPTCADYCKIIATNCNGGNNELGVTYIDMSQCNMWCTKNYGWPAGAAGATSGNTIGCRTYHAGAAMANPATHCPHAGPSGANVCGSWCDNYCYLALRNCTGPLALYPDLATCMTACSKIPAGGMPNATSGNTVQCRIYHLGVAGTDATSAMTHCPHGSSPPTGPCM